MSINDLVRGLRRSKLQKDIVEPRYMPTLRFRWLQLEGQLVLQQMWEHHDDWLDFPQFKWIDLPIWKDETSPPDD